MILTDPATMTTPNRYDRLRGNEAFPCVCLRVSNPPRRTTVIDTDQRIADACPTQAPGDDDQWLPMPAVRIRKHLGDPFDRMVLTTSNSAARPAAGCGSARSGRSRPALSTNTRRSRVVTAVPEAGPRSAQDRQGGRRGDFGPFPGDPGGDGVLSCGS